MSTSCIIRPPDRREPSVRAIVGRWRSLTGGGPDRNANRRTLIACSGGADSSALALALRSAGSDLVIAHVVHDLRPRDEALADRDGAARLAEALGLEFAEGEVAVGAGNPEATARRARYDLLASLAGQRHCPYLATAHHADDQLETVLMRLLRGAGPRGLAGISPSRPLGGVTLIRPMLAVGRAEAEAICRIAGWTWSEDRTNADLTRLRSRLRQRVLPELRRIEPRAGERAVEAGELLRQAGELVRVRASELIPAEADGAITLCRARIAAEPLVVAGEAIRLAVAAIAPDASDRLPRRVVTQIASAIREHTGQAKRFNLHSVEVRIEAQDAVFERSPCDRRGKGPIHE